MDLEQKRPAGDNADSVVSVLSTAKTPPARITFLPAHKGLHLGIRTQPSGTKKYVVVRRPADSTKTVIVTLCAVARGEKETVKLAIAANTQLDRGMNPNEQKRQKRAAERAEKLKSGEQRTTSSRDWKTAEFGNARYSRPGCGRPILLGSFRCLVPRQHHFKRLILG